MKETTLMSDRDKELIAASDILAPTVIRAFCCQYLNENFITWYGRGLATNFWSITQARSIAKYESAMLAPQEIKPAAAEYLQNIDPTFWVHAFFFHTGDLAMIPLILWNLSILHSN